MSSYLPPVSSSSFYALEEVVARRLPESVFLAPETSHKCSILYKRYTYSFYAIFSFVMLSNYGCENQNKKFIFLFFNISRTRIVYLEICEHGLHPLLLELLLRCQQFPFFLEPFVSLFLLLPLPFLPFFLQASLFFDFANLAKNTRGKTIF